MIRIRKVYVAGPYGSDASKIQKNTRRAQEIGRAIGTLGGRVLPVVPHNLSTGFAEIGDREYWLAATLEVLRGCDCLLAMVGWQDSEGCQGEVLEAKLSGMIPVVYACPDWTDADYQREVEEALFRWGAK